MNEPSSRDLLARLIGFATVSRDSNLELIGFIRDYLAGLGVDSELFHNSEGTKANLFATIGPLDKGGVVLSGHTDVVPVDGQAWTVEPFCLSERDGRLYGRGAADMKGFIASVLAAVPAFLAQPLQTPCTWPSPMTKKSVAWACVRCSQHSSSGRTNHACA